LSYGHDHNNCTTDFQLIKIEVPNLDTITSVEIFTSDDNWGKS